MHLQLALVIFFLFPCICEANLRDGLVGWWKFDNTGISAFDSSWNGNPAAVPNAPFLSNCTKTNCRDFPGSPAFGSIGFPAILNLPNSITISAWIYAYDVTTTQATSIVVDSNSVPNGGQYVLEFGRTAGKVDAFMFQGSQTVTGSTTLIANTWYHVVMTRSGSSGSWLHTLYLNGVQDAQGTLIFNPDAQQNLSIGRSGASSGAALYFNGRIDDVRIYNRVLTNQEIQDLYNPGILIRGSGTVLKGSGSQFNY